MRIVGVIPARYASTRFPGKPLALIKRRSLLERVWRQVRKCRNLDDVIIATDDQRIRASALAFGAKAVLTSPECRSGTDRLAEVARKIEKKAGILINIQGDEPLISPGLIDTLASTLEKEKDVSVITAVHPLRNLRESRNPNVVKAVLDEKGFALYFSRYSIPFNRSKSAVTHFKHIGIYGYRREFLLKFAAWRQTWLEKTEQLEQLRILEKGFKIKAIVSPNDSFGVDVPDDIKKIERLLK